MLNVTSLIYADDYEKVQELKKQKIDIEVKMHHKRVELIKKEKSLMDLEKKILSLQKELAIRIDNNEEMRELIDKWRSIKTQLKMLGAEDN